MIAKGYRASFWDNENVLKLNVVMVEHICEYTKNHRNVHFKWINYTACELYFNEIIILKSSM